MKTIIPARLIVHALLSLALLVVSSASTQAVDVTTDPVGFITLTAGGTNNPPNASPYITQYALGMTQMPVSRGNATANGAGVIAVSDSAVATGQFNQRPDGNYAYFIELTSGTYAGLMDDIVSNTGTNIHTADDLTSYLGAGTTYKVYPHWTIGTVFGPTNSAGFLGGGDSSVADNIQVWNPNTQGYANYYYKTTSFLGGKGWRTTSDSYAEQSNAVVYLDQGILVARRTLGNVDVKLIGGVKLGQTICPITNGVTFVGNVYPASMTLGQSGLYTTNNATGLAGGGDSSTADNVQIWNPSTQGYTIYYYKTTSFLGGKGWRTTSDSYTDASTNAIPAGGVGLILRQAGNSQFSWFAPQPF